MSYIFIPHRIHVWYIYANIWGILMVNVTIYSIHGSYGYILGYCLTNMGPIKGLSEKGAPPNSNGLSSCSSLTASELLFSLYPDPVCSPDARHCGTTQVLSFSVEDSWGAQKQSPNYCKTSPCIHGAKHAKEWVCLCLSDCAYLHVYGIWHT